MPLNLQRCHRITQKNFVRAQLKEGLPTREFDHVCKKEARVYKKLYSMNMESHLLLWSRVVDQKMAVRSIFP